jgi:gamma-glutamylcyclotransferase (GGCT)/AIG2-like uncharacterized protein YtfP
MVEDPSGEGVVGEVHEITPDMLPWFDRMELGAGYTRIPIEVEVADGGAVVECFTYVMEKSHWMKDRLIPSGDWKNKGR